MGDCLMNTLACQRLANFNSGMVYHRNVYGYSMVHAFFAVMGLVIDGIGKETA